jgi:hypothetical protein
VKCNRCLRAYFFFLAVDFFAVDFFAVDFLAVDFFAADFLAVDFFAVDFLAVDFLAAGFLAVDFLAVDFLAVDLLAVLFLLAVDFLAGMFTSSRSSRRHALQAPTFPFAHPAPHAVPLVAAQGVVQAFDPNGALGADALGLAGRPSLLGEEDLRVVVSTSGTFLPRDEVMHRASPESHACDSD